MGDAGPDRELFLGVTGRVFEQLFADQFGQLIIEKMKVKVLVFDESAQRIVQSDQVDRYREILRNIVTLYATWGTSRRTPQ